jgi:hypothetical protein
VNSKELQKKVENLEKEVKTLKDIEQINILQRAYGYYMDNLMYDDAADLFTADGHGEFGSTLLQGQEEIRTSFRNMTKPPFEGTKKLFLHMQLQGVVHVDDGGQTARGRWQMLCLSVDYLGEPPGELTPIISHGVYENEYAKENDNWKIKRLIFNSSFHSTLYDGWVKTTSLERTYDEKPEVTADVVDRTWRSGYKVPCHFMNPVTGK